MAISIFGRGANSVDDVPLHGGDAEPFECIMILLSIESSKYVHVVLVYGSAMVFDGATGHGWVGWVYGPPVVYIVFLLFVFAFFCGLIIMIR